MQFDSTNLKAEQESRQSLTAPYNTTCTLHFIWFPTYFNTAYNEISPNTQTLESWLALINRLLSGKLFYWQPSFPSLTLQSWYHDRHSKPEAHDQNFSNSKHKSTSCQAQLVHSTVFLSSTHLPISKGQAYFTHHQQCLLFCSFLPSFTLTHLLLIQEEKTILVLFYPSKDPILIHYPQTSDNLPNLQLPPVPSDT